MQLSYFTKLEKVYILPQTIYKFTTSEEISKDISEKVKNLQWVANVSNQRSSNDQLHKTEEFEDLHNWFKTCIEQVKQDLGYSCTEIKITQCWANRSVVGQFHHPHAHPNSVFSGIYYVNDSECTTNFGLPSKWQKFYTTEPLLSSFELFSKPQSQVIFDTIKPKMGNLIIFPSNLEHAVDPNTGPIRYSISFNTFPSGDIGNFGLLSGLSIEVK